MSKTYSDPEFRIDDAHMAMLKDEADSYRLWYEHAKQRFEEQFALNPEYAIQWHAEQVVGAQTLWVLWQHLLEAVEAGEGQHSRAAVAEAYMKIRARSSTTSVMDRANREVQRQAAADFLRTTVGRYVDPLAVADAVRM